MTKTEMSDALMGLIENGASKSDIIDFLEKEELTEVRRLQAVLTAVKVDCKWMDIATSPKDGTNILIMTGETMHVVRWENVHGDFDYWVVDDNKHGPFTLRGKKPTHWMPLPEPAP